MTEAAAGEIRYSSRVGYAVVGAATLGSGLTLLDGTVVNVALRTIGDDLDAGMAELQWINNGYLLTMASLILLGGSLGDRFGRRFIFVVGTVWFALASLLCGLAPNAELLIVARLLQGIGAALLTPGSLAMIQGAFTPLDRARAIGAWSGLGGIAAALGPFLGGVLIDYASWRWIFLINLPLAAATVLVTLRAVPETRDPEFSKSFDVAGAFLAAAALGGTTYALIEWGQRGALAAGIAGVVAGVAFVVVEARSPHPMMPLELFRTRLFSAANAMTLLVYAALGAVFFFLVLQLQTVAGYGALAAGVATLPVTIAMLFLAARFGALGSRIGPRIPMTAGPLLMAVGLLMMLAIDSTTSYWRDVLPGLSVFGIGLAMMVAPLTATVLAAAPDRHAGVASGINNAVARTGSLLAVAALPLAVGLSGTDYEDPVAFDDGFRLATIICAGLLAAGGLVSWLTIRNPGPVAVVTAPAPERQ
ncbi:MFS transporter [Nocardioides speluncae]|uniref:MFS transporter n=1 Tax=Nocardioides speluncae TaxID=2670337 RepID=UPI000D693A34|nr:MFS transporter [Nocardioides speluncae]